MSTTLLNVPQVSQLTTVTGDGKPSENAQFDCVPASVDMLCRYVLGTPENSIFNPDHFKDEAYGENWVNQGTAASAYVAYCKSLGVHLYSEEATDSSELVAMVRAHIKNNQPCLFTRDDPYVDQRVHPDWTHVCVFVGEDDAGLTAHDPYINQHVYKTDAGWIDVLRSNQIWLAERIAMSTLDNLIAHEWKDDGATLTAPNGVPVVLGFRQFVLSTNWNPGNWPVAAQYYTARLEDSNPALGPGDQQPFYDTLLGYPHDPQPPNENLKEKVIIEYVGKELMTARQQVAKYYALVQSLQKQLAQQGAPLLSSYLAAIKQADAILHPLANS